MFTAPALAANAFTKPRRLTPSRASVMVVLPGVVCRSTAHLPIRPLRPRLLTPGPSRNRVGEFFAGLFLSTAQNSSGSWVHKVHPSAGCAFNPMIGVGILECLFRQRRLNRVAGDRADKNERSHGTQESVFLFTKPSG